MKSLSYLLLPLLSSAATLEITIPPTTALPNPAVLSSTTRATLSSFGPPLVAQLTTRNTFVFSDVKPGSYLLSATSRDHAFEDLRVDIEEQSNGLESVMSWQTFRGNEWENKGEVRGAGEGSATLEVRALYVKEYFQQRNSFSVMSMFKSPMILLGVFTLAMVFGMPYLMDNLDPEIKKEMEEMQKSTKLGATSTSTSNLANRDFAGELASWMSGSKSK